MAGKTVLTEAERDVLKVLWERGPTTVRAMQQELEVRGRRWAYSTVATLVQRLAVKGCVATDSTTVPYVYSSAVSREELLGRRLRDAADELCDGNLPPLLLALVQGDYFSPEELAGFRRIIDDAALQGGSSNSRNRILSKRKKP